jgi:hypothetical protein
LITLKKKALSMGVAEVDNAARGAPSVSTPSYLLSESLVTPSPMPSAPTVKEG